MSEDSKYDEVFTKFCQSDNIMDLFSSYRQMEQEFINFQKKYCGRVDNDNDD